MMSLPIVLHDTFAGDMYSPTGDRSNDEEPEWVRTEREQFQTHHDRNNDGFMDHDEVRDWVIPDEYDHTVAEAKHLIFEADADQVGLDNAWFYCAGWSGQGATIYKTRRPINW